MDLVQEIYTQMQNLDTCLKQYKITGEASAKAEHDYRITLNKKTLELRADGQPATLIQLMVYGDKEVALERMKRDIALTTHEACKEAINVYKLKIRVLEGQFSKEYYNE